MCFVFFLMIRRPPRSTQGRSSAASDVYKRQTMHSLHGHVVWAQAWPVVVGFSLGAVGGHFINMQIKKSFLEKLIGLSLLAVACMLVLKFLFHIG